MAWPVALARVGSIVVSVIQKLPKGAWPKVAEYLGNVLKLAPGVAAKMNPVNLITAVYKAAGSVWKMLALLFKAMCACGYVYFAVEAFNMLRSLIPDDAVDALLDIFKEEGVDVQKVDANGDIVIDVTPGKEVAKPNSRAVVPAKAAITGGSLATAVIPRLAVSHVQTEINSKHLGATREFEEYAVKQEALRSAISALGSYSAFLKVRKALLLCDDGFLANYNRLRG